MLRRIGWLAVVTALIFLSAPATENVEARSRRQSRPFALRAHVVDFESKTHPKRRSRERSFEAYETHTLELDVFRRRRATTERATHVKLYLPNGDLYSAVELVPFEEEVESTGRRRRRRMPTATARVRVSGTVITEYGLYGQWSAQVCWESGSETTCGRGITFEIH